MTIRSTAQSLTSRFMILAIWLDLCCLVVAGNDSANGPIYQNSFDQPVPGLELIQGQVGMAASFDGIDDHLSIGELGDRNQVTVTFWLSPDAKQIADNEGYHGLVTSNGWEKGVMHFCYQAGRAQCYVHLGGGSRAHVASPILPKNKWSHIALAADIQNNRLTLYVNGNSSAVAHGLEGLDSIKLIDQVIGGEQVGKLNRFFKGAIDEVRIYDRVLSNKEIAAMCPGAPRLTEPTFDEKFRIHAADAAKANPDTSTFPTYHYMAPFGPWFGDVNGPLFHDGWFHVFYQWRLPGEQKVCWGHARSRDLIDWQHLPAAIAPRGSRGSWSGGAIVTKAGPRILFTSDYQQSGSVGSDDLIHWTPMEKEPAMSRTLHTSQGVSIGGWRDPFLWKHDGEYYACIGGGADGHGYVSLYRATNESLDAWEFVGPLFIHPDSPDNACPNFFPIGDKWVLLMSRHKPHVEDWFVGTWDPKTLRFQPETSGILGYNEATYATQGLVHPDGRVIYWNTIHQWRRANKPLDWPGALSLPRELSIADDGTLRIKPLAELSRLRGEHFHAENISLTDTTKLIQDIEGDALEIRITIEPQDAESFGIIVRRSDDGTRGLEVRYRDTITVDGEEALYSVQHGKENDPVRKPFQLKPGEPLKLTIYIDKLCFEAFVNDRIVYDRIIHASDQTGNALALPTENDLGIALFAENGAVKIKSIDVWKMNGIKLTTYEP